MTSPFSHLEKARYIMIGGFLGAGKTTAVLKLARHLADQELRVGLITNDQGNQLADTTTLISHGFMVEEIAGGCFCCRFNSLLEAAENLTAANLPQFFIAEPVGSCTDLVATVSYPLRRMYGDHFCIAPLSVLVDPIRALRILGVETGDRFSPKIAYIYRKQLEEAGLIVINKCDLIERPRLDALREALSKNFPQAELFEISARHDTGLLPWFERIISAEQNARHAMSVDYQNYGEGEALLGWLNATIHVSSDTPWDGNEFVAAFAGAIQGRLEKAGAEIAHLKMTLSPEEGFWEIALINVVRNGLVPELSQTLPDPLQAGELIVNIRAETDPETLRRAFEESFSECLDVRPQLKGAVEHLEHFRPGQPAPTHRMDASEEAQTG
jgi:G3E family GTPase